MLYEINKKAVNLFDYRLFERETGLKPATLSLEG